MIPHWRALARLTAGLAVCVVVAACGTSNATSSPSAGGSAGPSVGTSPAPSLSASGGPTTDPAAVYAAIEAQVEQLRELQPKSPVTPTLLDDATLKKNVAANFTKDNPPNLMAANQHLMELMGLIPAGSSLTDLYIALLGSQVAGYYDPATKQLYVVSKSGSLGPIEKVTFSHEYTHALQDQNFGLKNLALDAIGQGDASLAHLSVAEGDATLLMSLWAQSNLTPAELLALVQAGSDPEQTKILNEMPDILKETLLFPYTSGLQMVLAAQTSGGWPAVNAMFARPPASTEQVLHADKYAAGEAPISVTFPADLAARLGTGWSVDMQDTLGEFQLGVWLRSAGKIPQATATAAAAGWGGDRVALVRNGDRVAAVIDTRWDTPADADEFAAAATTTLHNLTSGSQLIHPVGGNRVTLFLGDSASIAALANVLGLAG